MSSCGGRRELKFRTNDIQLIVCCYSKIELLHKSTPDCYTACDDQGIGMLVSERSQALQIIINDSSFVWYQWVSFCPRLPIFVTTPHYFSTLVVYFLLIDRRSRAFVIPGQFALLIKASCLICHWDHFAAMSAFLHRDTSLVAWYPENGGW